MDSDGRVVVGGLFEHQRKIWDMPNFVKVLVGGLGAGKSALGCKRIIALALENAPCPVAIVSPTFAMARRTVIPQISEYLQGKQTKYGQAFWWRYNAAVHEFRFRYRGREALIMVLSGERPDSLRGPNLAAAVIDEPFIQPFVVFQQIVSRIRHPDSVRKELLLCGTPDLLYSWGEELCTGKLKGIKDVGVVVASTRKNKALDEGFVPRLEGVYSEKAAQAMVEGKFVNLSEGVVYYAFDPYDHVVDMPIPDGAMLGCGMDFNVMPMAMTVFWMKGQHMHFIDEFELKNADTEYACSVLKEKYWDQGLREVFPDATGKRRQSAAPGGKSDFHYIRNAGFDIRCRESNPERKDRYNAVNGKFRPRSGGTSLTISPKCEKLVRYLANYSHDLMHKQDQFSHLLDSFSYPIAYLFPLDREALRVSKLYGV